MRAEGVHQSKTPLTVPLVRGCFARVSIPFARCSQAATACTHAVLAVLVVFLANFSQ
jgi:hypothetical protein